MKPMRTSSPIGPERANDKTLAGAVQIIAAAVLALFAQALFAQTLFAQETGNNTGTGAATATGGLVIEVPERSDLEPVLLPALNAFESTVAKQLQDALDLARTLIDEARVDRAEGDEVLAQAFGDLGKLLHAYELLDGARAAYRNAITLTSADATWRYFLGHAARAAGDLDRAITAWNETLALIGSADSTFHTHLGRAYQERGDLDEAETQLRKALEHDADNAAAKASLGELALERGDASAAIVLLESALAKVPAANRLHYPLALAYRKAGEAEKARAHLAQRGSVGLTVTDRRLAELEELKNGERVFLLRGRRAFAAGRFEEAAQAFSRALEAQPESVRARVNLGTALGQLGDIDGAITAFRQAVEQDAENATAQFNLGQLLLRRGDLASIAHLEAAALAAPTDATMHRVLADALRAAGRHEEAFASYREATAWAPNDEAAALGRAATLITLERFEAARDWLAEAHTRVPTAGRIAAALAKLLAASPELSIRDGEQALHLAQTVFRATRGGEEAHTVALALAEFGRCAEAAEWQRQLLEALPESDARRVAYRAEHAAYLAGPPCRPPVG